MDQRRFNMLSLLHTELKIVQIGDLEDMFASENKKRHKTAFSVLPRVFKYS